MRNLLIMVGGVLLIALVGYFVINQLNSNSQQAPSKSSQSSQSSQSASSSGSPSSSGISKPQVNCNPYAGNDGDGDNNCGPDDGDGNL